MYCKECGKQIDNASKFCSYCGTKQSINQVSENKIDLSTKPDPIPQNVNISLSFKKANDKSKSDEIKVDKYDRTYKGDSSATVVASILMIIILIISLIVKFDNQYDYAVYLVIGVVLNIIWRIVATFWTVDIAKRQNRDTIGWGFFAFFIPNLALFIIGLLKKLNKPSRESPMSESNQVLPKEDVSNVNSTDNVEVGAIENFFSHNVELESGTVSDNITYKVFMIEKMNTFWSERLDELKIEFSDGKMGKVFFSNSLKKYYFRSGLWWPNYYNSKNAAIKALHYYLCYKRVMVKDIYYYM
ncbi:MAG: zinc ribbon domain-containing protein [Bacteroidota bacterium]